MIKIYCDICGRQLENTKNIDVTLYNEGCFNDECFTFELDLCDEHYEQFSKQMCMSTAHLRADR